MHDDEIESLKKQNKKLKEENEELQNIINSVINWYYIEQFYADSNSLDKLRDILKI